MADFVASSGTTALGIIGTVLGSIGTLASGGNLLGNANNTQYVTKEMFEHNNADLQLLAEKDSQIAELQADQNMNSKVLDLYKYVETQFKDIRDNQNTKWTEQAVINSQVNSGLNVLSSQVNDLDTTLKSITKTAVPTSAICSFGSCNGDL